jgi:hypothetical protein
MPPKVYCTHLLPILLSELVRGEVARRPFMALCGWLWWREPGLNCVTIP